MTIDENVCKCHEDVDVDAENNEERAGDPERFK